MVTIFDGRMEITSPGAPLVATDRLVDFPPKSRNEELASLMRRFRICEERDSRVDKVVYQTVLHQLPAPLFEARMASPGHHVVRPSAARRDGQGRSSSRLLPSRQLRCVRAEQVTELFGPEAV